MKKDKFLEAVERLLVPFRDVPRELFEEEQRRRERERIEKHGEIPEVTCDICRMYDEAMLSENATKMMLQMVPWLQLIVEEIHEVICTHCLQRFVGIQARAMEYDPLKKRYVTIATKTYPCTLQNLEMLLRVKAQRPVALQLRLVPRKREIKREFQRRYWRETLRRARKDEVDRLYENIRIDRRPTSGIQQLAKYLREVKEIVRRPSVEDVVKVLKGEAEWREPRIGCYGCKKAVCPKDCPRKAVMDYIAYVRREYVEEREEYLFGRGERTR